MLEAIYAFVPAADREGADAVRRSWRKQWTALQQRLGDIPAVALKEVVPNLEELFRRKTFQESLYDCLSQEWIDRYNGARDTQLRLQHHAGTVRQACRPFVVDVFDELVAERSDLQLDETMYRNAHRAREAHGQGSRWSLMPLSYSLGPLEKSVRQAPMLDAAVAEQVRRLTGDVRAFIERTKTDSGAQVRAALTRIEMHLPARAGSEPAGIGA